MWHFPLLSQFDPDNTGYISTEKFRSLLQRHGSELDPHKLEVLLALADSNSEARLCFGFCFIFSKIPSYHIRIS